MAEVYASTEQTMAYFGSAERPGAHFPFNFNLMGLTNVTTAHQIKQKMDTWIDNLPDFGHSNWVVSFPKIFSFSYKP